MSGIDVITIHIGNLTSDKFQPTIVVDSASNLMSTLRKLINTICSGKLELDKQHQWGRCIFPHLTVIAYSIQI